MTDSQKAFEDNLPRGNCLEKDAEGGYTDPFVDDHWQTWKEAIEWQTR